MSNTWKQSKLDREIAAELEGFLPEKIFDVHAHLYRIDDLNVPPLASGLERVPEVTADLWREQTSAQVGGSRLVGGLFIPFPTADCDVERCNQWVIRQLGQNPDSRGLILVTPRSDPETISQHVENDQIVGFKPYHCFSGEADTFQSSIESFLPSWAWQIADRHGLVITLHMVKDRALADPQNQREIRNFCLNYPNAKLILAHAGRGFYAPNTIKGIEALKDLQNVWFDTAVVCEAAPLAAILKEFGPRKLLWGSDFPVAVVRGKCVTMGDAFIWLYNETIAWETLKTPCNQTLIGLEALRALRQACDECFLNDQDVADIFCDNAFRLLGMVSEPGNEARKLYNHAKQRIPGGTQLLSKRPEREAPGKWPAYFREARGCETWDLDGRHYYDMSTNGIGACLLGFRDPDVTRAVQRRISLGSMSTLNPPEEVELADLLCEIHPWADQVRFARTGGETAAVAVRIARATTGRSMVAVCGYCGWHDWYLAANLGDADALDGHLLPGLDPAGVPRELRGTVATFHYNSEEEFQAVIDRYGDRLAAVIVETCRYHDPKEGFLELIRERTRKCGAILIFDEITIGFRLCMGGAHLKFGVDPDIAIFAKALGNGHPIGAVIGTKEAMEGANISFISSTYWTESVGPTAALATIRKMQQLDVPGHIARIGNLVAGFWQSAGEKHGLPVVTGDGYPCLAHFRFDHELAREMQTLYTELMIDKGFLSGVTIYPTMAHTEEVVSRYGAAIDEVFGEIADALAAGEVERRLAGPVAVHGFARLT